MIINVVDCRKNVKVLNEFLKFLYICIDIVKLAYLNIGFWTMHMNYRR